MITIGIIVAILAFVNFIPYLAKYDKPILRNRVASVLLILVVLTLVLFFLETIGIRVKGNYSNKLIAVLTTIASLVYFALDRRVIYKLVANAILLPVILLSAYNLFFVYRLGSYRLSDDFNIVVSSEGFLGCGETMRVTEDKLLVFDRTIKELPPLCLIGISNIEPVDTSDTHWGILIYHNGVRDSENPYYYRIEK